MIVSLCCSSQIWLLILMSLIVMIIVTTLVVRAEISLLGGKMKNVGARVSMWALKTLTQEGKSLSGDV